MATVANKISVSQTVKVSDASGGVGMTATDVFDQVGTNYSKLTQTITNAVPVKLVVDQNIIDGNLGYVEVRNLGVKVAGVLPQDQNYLNIASDAGMVNLIMSVQPGISHFFQPPLGTINLWAQAHVADVQATVMAIEI